MVRFPPPYLHNILHLPLAFVRSGYVRLLYGQSHAIGYDGCGWFRVSENITNAYSLYMNPSIVSPSNGNYRWFGFPLRAFTIFHLPLAFVRSGFLHLDIGQIGQVGYAGYNWSRISRSATNTYDLCMDPVGVYLSGHVRWYGLSLRCLYNGNV